MYNINLTTTNNIVSFNLSTFHWQDCYDKNSYTLIDGYQDHCSYVIKVGKKMLLLNQFLLLGIYYNIQLIEEGLF